MLSAQLDLFSCNIIAWKPKREISCSSDHLQPASSQRAIAPVSSLVPPRPGPGALEGGREGRPPRAPDSKGPHPGTYVLGLGLVSAQIRIPINRFCLRHTRRRGLEFLRSHRLTLTFRLQASRCSAVPSRRTAPRLPRRAGGKADGRQQATRRRNGQPAAGGRLPDGDGKPGPRTLLAWTVTHVLMRPGADPRKRQAGKSYSSDIYSCLFQFHTRFCPMNQPAY